VRERARTGRTAPRQVPKLSDIQRHLGTDGAFGPKLPKEPAAAGDGRIVVVRDRSATRSLLTKGNAFWTREKLKPFIERIRQYVSLVVVEHQLRREFRRPLGKGPDSQRRRPQLNKPFGFSGDSKIGDKPKIGAAEDLNKNLSKAKRRDLCVFWPLDHEGG
jgi:hypothetical protein